jgi:hypothetical protein
LYGSEIDACTQDSIFSDENNSKIPTRNDNDENYLNKKQKKKQTFVEIKVVYAQNMLELHTST